ncbi:MAG TPA: RsmE family RNA methyltransferase [Myxococcota bacterium]|nr:RsmE family RNA methyltransferase [Myxococcota bacterium]HOA12697.1 RsmE family RNA methyltransferase [Myxococcota bacterium]HOC99364.1 RsmE family RNA methyltransferase [Myxococcota bacterium]HOH76137.1 RsmE family RNA methyltransferase [Myxococcota bacterium]HPV03629.1 RsmE family RNA methyltransferase [Myxococcota bacterium]
MTIPRLFESGRELRPGSSFTPEIDVMHYLRRVLRLKPGDGVLVLDGGPVAWLGTLAGSDDGLGIAISGPAEGVRVVPDGRRICALVPALKGDRHEFAIQKATELGVTELRIYFADRSIPRPSARESAKLARWMKVAEEACRQCDRASVPLVGIYDDLGCATGELDIYADRYLLSEIGTPEPLARIATGTRPAVVAIGPEGSFTEAERGMLLQAGFVPAGLGPRVLKAETAVIAAVMAVQVAGGDIG